MTYTPTREDLISEIKEAYAAISGSPISTYDQVETSLKCSTKHQLKTLHSHLDNAYREMDKLKHHAGLNVEYFIDLVKVPA